MKKFYSLTLIFLLSALLATTAFAQGTLLLSYDGEVHQYTGKALMLKINGDIVETDIPPIILDDRSLVPARAVFEKMGANVGWNAKEQKVSVDLNNIRVNLKINDKKAVVNSKTVEMDVPAKIINDRTMIPLRFVSEQLKMKVGWFPEKRLVTVDYQNVPEEQVDKNSLTGIEYTKNQDQEIVTMLLSKYEKHTVFELSDPDRIVIDIPNTLVESSDKKMIGSRNIIAVRYAQNDEDTVRVVLDVVGKRVYRIENKSDRLIVLIDSMGTGSRGEGPTIPENGGNGSDTGQGVPGEQAEEPNSSGDGNTEDDNQEGGQSNPPDDSKDGSQDPTGDKPPQGDTTDPGLVNKDLDVKFASSTSVDQIAIAIDSTNGYNAFRLTGTDRIVVDIPTTGVEYNMHTLAGNSRLVKSVRWAQYDQNTLRVVVDLAIQAQYHVEKQKNQLVLNITKPTYKNIAYHNSSDRVYLTLNGATLTQGGEYLKKLYTEQYDSSGKTYTITFPSSQANLGAGRMAVNDAFLESVEIKQSGDGKQTSLVFHAKDKFVYRVMARSSVNDTAITILKPASKQDRLVVIDPGHGGVESGAVHGGVYEKHLNLDISLRLNKLLKSKGIKTYIIREDDSYVSLYERAYIANDLNATLFMSIHNNAFYSSTSGTETLYYPQRAGDTGFNGRRFAEIVQKNLISTLKTKDRKIIERPNLVVLKGTTMPAVLAEIAFITNDSDRAKLLDENFRQKAAEALCESIIQALKEAP